MKNKPPWIPNCIKAFVPFQIMYISVMQLGFGWIWHNFGKKEKKRKGIEDEKKLKLDEA